MIAPTTCRGSESCRCSPRKPRQRPMLICFIVALLDSFGRVLRRRLRDPIGYLESWISIEQPFGDAEKAADATVTRLKP